MVDFEDIFLSSGGDQLCIKFDPDITQYAVTVAEGKNVTLSIDVSKRATKYLKKLTANDNKTLCRYMGVFIDNAIEAS